MKNQRERLNAERLACVAAAKAKAKAIAVALLLCLSVLSSQVVRAGEVPVVCQDEPNPHRVEIGAGLRLVPFSPEKVGETEFNADNATLKTDPELESTLKKAVRYRDDGNYSFACKLWQLVLEKSGDTLYSEDDERYYSLVQQVERILATLPAEGLAAYRVDADAEAKQILAKGRGPLDEQALSKVVRSYFVSSVGDESAFKLACLYLDQHNFIGAERLLRKIIEDYPDPSIPLDQVFVRLSLCYVLMDNIPGAKATLEQAHENSDGSIADLATIVSKTLEQVGVDGSDFQMGVTGNRFGAFRVMPAPPESFMDDNLTCVWQAFLEPAKPFVREPEVVLVGADAHGEVGAGSLDTRFEKPMIKLWREEGWRPAGDLLFDDGKVFYKSPTRMTAWDAEDLGSAEPLWKSAWLNKFPLDDATKTLMSITRSRGRRGQALINSNPSDLLHVQIFGDRVFQKMSMHDGTIYTLEGDQFESRGTTDTSLGTGVQYNTAFRRSRSNYLVAYDGDTGKVKWTIPKIKADDKKRVNPNPEDELTSEFLLNGGMMSAPIGFDNLLLVPVNVGGAIMVYALDAENKGRTVWKSFLCDEPDTGAEPWSPINLSIRGSDLYVGTGMGVVFVLDASTGLIQLGKRYPRVGETNKVLQQYGWRIKRFEFDGWSADEVIPYGSQIICFCSDTDVIQALNTTDGSLVWEVEMEDLVISKLDYILGIQNDVLYLAGSETVLAFDLKQEGLMIWGGMPLFDGKRTCGRGMLTTDGVYMPIEDSIWKFGLQSDKDDNGKDNGRPLKLAESHVDLGIDAPVGNLYSDGKRIWVHGGNRIYALAPETKNSDGN